jgi:release factor glutamine methyltransferase
VATLAALLQASPLPRRETEIVLCAALKISKVDLLLHPEREVSGEDAERVRHFFTQRAAGVPFPYLTGEQEFFSRPFHVTPDVLIPRPDTECLIEWCLERIPDASRVVDLGTGSGCIAATLALENPTLEVSAVDISPKALAVARENAAALGARVRFCEGSWLDALPAPGVFDVIVSNPPYIEADDAHLDALRYEPISALTDGADGLTCIRAILRGAEERLPRWPLRIIAIEHGWNQGESVRRLFASFGFAGARTHKDYGGNDRFTVWEKDSA